MLCDGAVHFRLCMDAADTVKKHKIKDNANLSHSSCGTDVLCLVAFQLDGHGKFIKTTLELPVNDSGRAEVVT